MESSLATYDLDIIYLQTPSVTGHVKSMEPEMYATLFELYRTYIGQKADKVHGLDKIELISAGFPMPYLATMGPGGFHHGMIISITMFNFSIKARSLSL